MAIDLQTPNAEGPATIEDEGPPRPSISVIEDQGSYGKFHVEPLEPGYGMALGTPMRRILLSSVNVRKVNYAVERARVAQRSDNECLALEVWTDGSITPIQAVKEAASVLTQHFFLMECMRPLGEEQDALIAPGGECDHPPIEQLGLSPRTLTCLKRAGICEIRQLMVLKSTDLMQIRNFGEKSFTELYGRLKEMELLPGEPDLEADGQDGTTASEEQ